MKNKLLLLLVIIFTLSINVFSQSQGKYYINRISGHEYKIDKEFSLENTVNITNKLNYINIGTDMIKIYCNGHIVYLLSRYLCTLVKDDITSGIKAYSMFSYFDNCYKKVKIKVNSDNSITFGIERSATYFEIFSCEK